MDQKSKFNDVSKVEMHSVEGGSCFGRLFDLLKKLIPRTPPTVPIDRTPSRLPIRA